MFKQLTKIFQEKYPHLRIQHVRPKRSSEYINIFNSGDLLIQIYQNKINWSGGYLFTPIYISPTNPNFLHTIDELIENAGDTRREHRKKYNQ